MLCLLAQQIQSELVNIYQSAFFFFSPLSITISPKEHAQSAFFKEKKYVSAEISLFSSLLIQKKCSTQCISHHKLYNTVFIVNSTSLTDSHTMFSLLFADWLHPQLIGLCSSVMIWQNKKTNKHFIIFQLSQKLAGVTPVDIHVDEWDESDKVEVYQNIPSKILTSHNIMATDIFQYNLHYWHSLYHLRYSV
jgi:hypothetical protein